MIVKEGANAFNDLHGFKFQLVAGEKVCFFSLILVALNIIAPLVVRVG